MKTWQMIKELTENPDKEFQLVGEKGKRVFIEDSRDGKKINLNYVDYMTIEDNWEEVKEPVDFMTAVKSGKKIRVEHTNIDDRGLDNSTIYTPLDCLIYTLGSNYYTEEVKDILLNGKWYIEE